MIDSSIFKLATLLMLTHVTVHACRDPLSETTTLLDKLPATAINRPVVAKVSVIAVDQGKPSDVRVKVVEAIKGTTVGAALRIALSDSSCAREPRVEPAATYFIAGATAEPGRFRGEWTKRERLDPVIGSALPSDTCRSFKCTGTAPCGCTLLGQGWREVARCGPGRYLIEKAEVRKVCVRVGNVERECTPFTDDVRTFSKCPKIVETELNFVKFAATNVPPVVQAEYESWQKQLEEMEPEERIDGAIAWYDFNEDGKPDLCASYGGSSMFFGMSGGHISCFVNDGGHFRSVLANSGMPEYVVVSSAKTKGYFDLHLGGPGTGKFYQYHWNGKEYD